MTKGTEVLLLGKLHEKVLPEDFPGSQLRWLQSCGVLPLVQRVSKLQQRLVVEGIHLALGR